MAKVQLNDVAITLTNSQARSLTKYLVEYTQTSDFKVTPTRWSYNPDSSKIIFLSEDKASELLEDWDFESIEDGGIISAIRLESGKVLKSIKKDGSGTSKKATEDIHKNESKEQFKEIIHTRFDTPKTHNPFYIKIKGTDEWVLGFFDHALTVKRWMKYGTRDGGKTFPDRNEYVSIDAWKEDAQHRDLETDGKGNWIEESKKPLPVWGDKRSYTSKRIEFIEYMTGINGAELRKLNTDPIVKLAQFCLNFYAIKNPMKVSEMAEKLDLSSFQADMA